jgi:actin-related protein 7, plant
LTIYFGIHIVWIFANLMFYKHVFIQVITIEKEQYIVGEALFQPHILGLEDYGIVHQLVTCVSNVSSEYHRQLLENTMLCGGTISMTG